MKAQPVQFHARRALLTLMVWGGVALAHPVDEVVQGAYLRAQEALDAARSEQTVKVADQAL